MLIFTVIIIILGLYAELMLSLFFGFRKLIREFRNNPPVDGPEPLMKISVIIPARNEADQIPTLLSSLSKQSADPQLFEIIVVDDYSDDNTLEIARRALRGITGKVISLRDAGLPGGKKMAVAYGISQAQNPLILLTDADCMAGKGWVTSYSRLFSNKGCLFAAGPVKLDPVEGVAGAMEALDFYGLIGASAGAAGLELPFMCNAANMAFLKETYLELGGMQPHYHLASGDDVLFLHQVVNAYGAGRVQWNIDYEAIITTKGTKSFTEFFTQRLRWASKSKNYRNKSAIAVAMIVLLTNIALIAGTLFSIKIGDPVPALLFFVLKAMGDIPIIYSTTKMFGQIRLLTWFIPLTILYPFYTSILGIASFFVSPTWKGRKIR
jgi:poly-beta-1,6-N-acetyl-D-glucosamine synthase